MQPRILIATAVAAVLVAPAAAPAQTPPEPEYFKSERPMYQPREPEIEPEPEFHKPDTSLYYPREPRPEPEPEFRPSSLGPRAEQEPEPEFRPSSLGPRAEQETEPELRPSQLLDGGRRALSKKEAIEHWIISSGGIIHADVQNPLDPSRGYFVYARPHGAGMAIAPY